MRRFASLVVLCLLILAPASVRATMLAIETRGGCPLDFPPDFYLIDEETGTFEEIFPAIDPVWLYCGIYGLTRRRSDGNFYATGYEWTDTERYPALIRIAPGTWDISTVTPITFAPGTELGGISEMAGLAFSPDDELYALIHLTERRADGSIRDYSSAIVRLDPASGEEEARFALPTPGPSMSLAFGPDGTFYGWSPISGLYTINPTMGTVSDVRPGDEDETNVITAIAFAPDGTLYGFGGMFIGYDNEGWIYTIDTRSGLARRDVYMGPDFWPMADAVAYVPERPRFEVFLERPPRRLFPHRLFLLDCLPCPQCFGRMCDPRVNPEQDRFFIVEPDTGVAEVFSRERAELRREDGPLSAGAPVMIGDRTRYVVSAPLADFAHPNAGAVLFLNRKGKVVQRIEGRAAGETLGLAMDVRGNEVAVASARELLRLRDGKVVGRMKLDETLRAQQGLRLSFADDVDGDQRPEIRLGAPYATADGLQQAGVVQLIGSKTGAVLESESGTAARQHLGGRLPR